MGSSIFLPLAIALACGGAPSAEPPPPPIPRAVESPTPPGTRIRIPDPATGEIYDLMVVPSSWRGGASVLVLPISVDRVIVCFCSAKMRTCACGPHERPIDSVY